jgi:hypothetical protein
MRVLVLIALAACTPDVVSGAYLCGPNASCPEGQACNGTFDEDSGLDDDTCVLASLARPFVCTPKVNLEPDDTMAQGHPIENLGCVNIPVDIDGCMAESDADWVTFVAPTVCAGTLQVHARLSFAIAYEQLSVELWDFAQNTRLATDGECKSGLDSGNVRRCLDFTLVPGTKYGIQVLANGAGDCGGECAYNRYSLSVGVGTSG